MTLVYDTFLSVLETNEISFNKITNVNNAEEYFNTLKNNILSNFNATIKYLSIPGLRIECSCVTINEKITIKIKNNNLPTNLLNFLVILDTSNKYYFIKDFSQNISLGITLLQIYPPINNAHSIQMIGYFGSQLHQYTSCLYVMRNIKNYSKILSSIINPLTYIPGEYENYTNNYESNESQKDAINNMTNNIEIIHGPPGTGKSTTIINIISTKIIKSHTILCTAVQNQAIETLAIKLRKANKSFLVFGSEQRLKTMSKKNSFETICSTNETLIESNRQKDNINIKIAKMINKCVNDETANSIKTLTKKITQIDTNIENEKQKILSKYHIFLCTSASSYRAYKIIKKPIQTIIMDEAGATTETEMPALLRLNPCNLILIGDHKQLKGFDNIPTHLITDKTYNISLLERLIESGRKHHLLYIQYRMAPQIRNIVSNLFYEGLLEDGNKKTDIGSLNTLKWVNVTDYESSDGHSYYNETEINEIMKQIYIHKNKQILVLTSYLAQLQKLKNFINNENIDIRTIDSSQGMEADVVICSLVRSNKNNSIGFLGDEHRLCVVLSRAKNNLIIVGNYHMFKNSCSLWNKITHFFSNNIEYI